MDLYSTIETGGHVKPELTGEDLAKFADCPIETAQETRAGEPARQPVEEVLQTTRETAEKCHARTTTLQAWAKAVCTVPAKTSRQKSLALSGIQNILNDRGGTGGNNRYNNPCNGNGQPNSALTSPCRVAGTLSSIIRGILAGNAGHVRVFCDVWGASIGFPARKTAARMAGLPLR